MENLNFLISEKELLEGKTIPKSDAINYQKRLAKYYDLGHWYGTWCKKCCDVFPRHVSHYKGFEDMMFYQCEVCGRRTKDCYMPWIARDEWNNDNVFYKDGQISLAQFM